MRCILKRLNFYYVKSIVEILILIHQHSYREGYMKTFTVCYLIYGMMQSSTITIEAPSRDSVFSMLASILGTTPAEILSISNEETGHENQ